MSKLNQDLVEYLKEFVVDERRELFEEKIKQRTKHITVVLENIFQGRNISASIRSADATQTQRARDPRGGAELPPAAPAHDKWTQPRTCVPTQEKTQPRPDPRKVQLTHTEPGRAAYPGESSERRFV